MMCGLAESYYISEWLRICNTAVENQDYDEEVLLDDNSECTPPAPLSI